MTDEIQTTEDVATRGFVGTVALLIVALLTIFFFLQMRFIADSSKELADKLATKQMVIDTTFRNAVAYTNGKQDFGFEVTTQKTDKFSQSFKLGNTKVAPGSRFYFVTNQVFPSATDGDGATFWVTNDDAVEVTDWSRGKLIEIIIQ